MKFQNPSFKFFLNGRTNERTSRKQYAPHFFKVGGIKISFYCQPCISLFHYVSSKHGVTSVWKCSSNEQKATKSQIPN